MQNKNAALNAYFSVWLDGNDLDPHQVRALHSMVVESSLHKPDVATLTLNDPELHWLDSGCFAPGKALKVYAQANQANSPLALLFDGEIVEFEPRFEAATHQLVVRAYDRLHRLMRGAHTRAFQNESLGDLVTRMAKEARLKPDYAGPRWVQPYAIQPNETNLAFLQRLLHGLGCLLYVQSDVLHVKPMHQALAESADAATLPLRWGQTLREFYPRISLLGQVDESLARGWDPLRHQEIVGRARKPSGAPDVELTRRAHGGEKAAQAFGSAAAQLTVFPPIRTQAEADFRAQAAFNQRAERHITAQGVADGQPAIKAGTQVQIDNIGHALSGNYWVTQATHTYSAASNYVTHFSITGSHADDVFSLLSPQASGAAAASLVIALVSDNQDPEGLGRVKVSYPWLAPQHASDWARVVTVGAGHQRGIQFLPDVGDEVLVGFEMGDMRFPYVLGGLFNGQDKPPYKNNQLVQGGKVQRNVIRDRAGNQIELHDEGGISLTDKAGNQMHLNSKGNKIVIEAKGDLSLKANGNLNLEANGQVVVKGTQIQLN